MIAEYKKYGDEILNPQVVQGLPDDGGKASARQTVNLGGGSARFSVNPYNSAR